MSGILDKKSRIIDFAITENGRFQLENGDIRYKFATISDKSIIYTKDHELSKSKKSDVSKSEFDYIPLEISTKLNDEINPEFDIREYFLYDNNKLKDFNFQENSDFLNQVDKFLTNSTLGNNLKNLKCLTTKTSLNSNKSLIFKDSGFLNNDIDFSNSKINKYLTVKKEIISEKELPVIALDKRFSHKTNFMFLPPKNGEGENLYKDSQYSNIKNLDKDNSVGFLFSSYNKKIKSKNISNRSKQILELIKDLQKDKEVHKKVYEIEESSDISTFIFELFEVDSNLKKLKKLHFIKVGDFYDKSNYTTKKVYLIGKIFNTRDSSKDLDTIFTFNNGNINLQSKSVFALSAYFSFVNLFTLIIE